METGKEYGVLSSYEIYHDFRLNDFKIYRVFENDGMRITGSTMFKCADCELQDIRNIDTKIHGSYVMIDDKLYFIPDNESVSYPIPVEGNFEAKVKYITTKSGLRIPVDLLSRDVAEKISKLDDEYASINCDDECPRNYAEFIMFKRKMNILREQISLVIEDLSKKFKITNENGKIIVTSPDGNMSSFRMNMHLGYVIKEYQGPYSILAELLIIENFIENGINEIRELPKNMCIIESEGKNIVYCEKRYVIAEKMDISKGKYMLVKFVDVNKDTSVAISVETLEPILFERIVREAVKNNKIINYGRIIMRCNNCELERPYFEDDTMNIKNNNKNNEEFVGVAINGEIYLYGKKLKPPYDPSEFKADVISVKLSMFYIDIGGIVIPLNYIPFDMLKQIIEIYATKPKALKEISRMVFEYLEKQGFKFKAKGECGMDFEAHVEAPDGRRGDADFSEWDGTEYYCCELAPLAVSYCDYADLNDIPIEEEGDDDSNDDE